MFELSHLCIVVPERSKMERFLKEILGFKLSNKINNQENVKQDIIYAQSNMSDLKIYLREEANGQISSWDHIAFVSSDLEKVWEKFISIDPSLTRTEPKIAPSGRKFMFIKGAAGELWQVLEDKSCNEELRLEHIGVNVDSLEEGIKFYNDVLNFELVPELYLPDTNPAIAFVKTPGGFMIELVKKTEPSRSGPVFDRIVFKSSELINREKINKDIHSDILGEYIIGISGEKIGLIR